jgi:hypothetical protein
MAILLYSAIQHFDNRPDPITLFRELMCIMVLSLWLSIFVRKLLTKRCCYSQCLTDGINCQTAYVFTLGQIKEISSLLVLEKGDSDIINCVK